MNLDILLGGMRPGSRGWLHPRTPCPSRAHTTRQRRSLDKLQAGLTSARRGSGNRPNPVPPISWKRRAAAAAAAAASAAEAEMATAASASQSSGE